MHDCFFFFPSIKTSQKFLFFLVEKERNLSMRTLWMKPKSTTIDLRAVKGFGKANKEEEEIIFKTVCLL